MFKKHLQRAERVKNDSVMEVFDSSGKVLSWSARLSDYSSTGAAFLSDKDLAPGEEIKAGIRIFGKGYFKITGKIVRKEKKDGLNFYAVKYSAIEQEFPTGEKKKFEGNL